MKTRLLIVALATLLLISPSLVAVEFTPKTIEIQFVQEYEPVEPNVVDTVRLMRILREPMPDPADLCAVTAWFRAMYMFLLQEVQKAKLMGGSQIDAIAIRTAYIEAKGRERILGEAVTQILAARGTLPNQPCAGIDRMQLLVWTQQHLPRPKLLRALRPEYARIAKHMRSRDLFRKVLSISAGQDLVKLVPMGRHELRRLGLRPSEIRILAPHLFSPQIIRIPRDSVRISRLSSPASSGLGYL